jgi:hypothetical protein
MSTRPALPLVSAASHMLLSATTDAPGLSAQPAWAGVRSESPHPAERTNKKTARSYGTGGLSDRPPLLRRSVSSPAPFPLPSTSPRRAYTILSGSRSRALLLAPHPCSVAQAPHLCPRAPHTRTDRILGRGPCLLLFTIKASPGPTNACILAPKLSVDCLTGAVQVTLGVVYVTLVVYVTIYFRLPITQRFPVRRPPATSQNGVRG